MTRTAVILLLVLSCLPGSGSARSQVARDVVATIDVQRIYRETKAAKAFRERIDQRRIIEQDRFRAREKTLLEADRDLRRQRPDLSEEAFARKGRALAEKVAALQRDVENHNRALRDRLDRGIGQVQRALIEVVGAIAAERSLNLVVIAGSVVLQNPKLDITDEAMARLDARLPEITLDGP